MQQDGNCAYPSSFRSGEAFAQELDISDPLRDYATKFRFPCRPDGRPLIYLCSHSLGLQPRSVGELMKQELDNWASLAVEGHFKGKTPWYTYPDHIRPAMARLVGAKTDEVTVMNGLTINLHLMTASFYHPTKERYKILIDDPTFPSDMYALQSQLRLHGYDPDSGLIRMQPRAGEHTIRISDIEGLLAERGQEIAFVVWNGVNFLTGQAFDLPRIVAAVRQQGCAIGFDLAHAAGNIVLKLHDWEPDFAVWCTYKYLNSGPGAVAACFVHEKHGQNLEIARMAGWWGNDPATRFRMQLQPEFMPQIGAGGWQVSNPPVLALVPIRASLALYDEIGMAPLRTKSECLTSYLLYLLDQFPGGNFEIITPREPAERGCQVSILVHHRPQELLAALQAEGIIADFREPNVIRVAPVPMYNSFFDVWEFCRIFASQVR